MKLILTPPNPRILALDLGKKRIGLALSDPLRITAQGLPNLVRTNNRADLEALSGLIRQHEVGLILMGNPINMGGKEGRVLQKLSHAGAAGRLRPGSENERKGQPHALDFTFARAWLDRYATDFPRQDRSKS